MCKKFGVPVPPVGVLGRRHGPNPACGIPDKVAAAYWKAGMASRASEIVDFHEEVRYPCLQAVSVSDGQWTVRTGDAERQMMSTQAQEGRWMRMKGAGRY